MLARQSTLIVRNFIGFDPTVSIVLPFYCTYRICEQRRLRRACASAQSRQSLHCSLTQYREVEAASDKGTEIVTEEDMRIEQFYVFYGVGSDTIPRHEKTCLREFATRHLALFSLRTESDNPDATCELSP